MLVASEGQFFDSTVSNDSTPKNMTHLYSLHFMHSSFLMRSTTIKLAKRNCIALLGFDPRSSGL